VTTAEGMPVAWSLANQKLGEREVAAALLAHARGQRILREGMVILTDKGPAGRAMERYATGRRHHLGGEQQAVLHRDVPNRRQAAVRAALGHRHGGVRAARGAG
jgi:hypothetical protein